MSMGPNGCILLRWEATMIRLLRAATVPLLVALMLPAAAVTAQAGLLDVTCEGTQTVTYSPGLLVVPGQQTIHTETSYAPCVSVSKPAVHSGEAVGNTTANISCETLLQGGRATRTITWNTGQTSTFT